MEQPHPGPRPSFWKSPMGFAAALLTVAASAYLWWAHHDHLLALLPYVFLAACPLMHTFMHRGHGHHHRGSSSAPGSAGRRDGDL